MHELKVPNDLMHQCINNDNICHYRQLHQPFSLRELTGTDGSCAGPSLNHTGLKTSPKNNKTSVIQTTCVYIHIHHIYTHPVQHQSKGER